MKNKILKIIEELKRKTQKARRKQIKSKEHLKKFIDLIINKDKHE